MGSDVTVKDMVLPDLGLAAGMAIWGFRAAIVGTARCHVVLWGYEQALANDGAPTLGDMIRLTKLFARYGRRKVRIGCPGTSDVTPDEMSVAAMFAAAQAEHEEAVKAHARWLLARDVPTEIVEIVMRIAAQFAHHGMTMKMISVSREVPMETPAPHQASLHLVQRQSGHA